MFRLGPYEYPSKEALKKKLREFLQKAPDGTIRSQLAQDKLHYLLLLHPKSDEKTGCGVREFKVARNVLGSGKGFMVVRVDASEERFSYKTCLEGVVTTHRSQVVEAMRFAVRGQLRKFRAELVLPVRCALTGETLNEYGDIHIDHKVPFWLLLRQFCQRNGIDLGALETVGTGEVLRLKDERILREFQAFHAEKARLQATSRQANIEKNGRFYR